MKNVYIATFIVIVCFGLWATSPTKTIAKCETVNTQEICNILNEEQGEYKDMSLRGLKAAQQRSERLIKKVDTMALVKPKSFAEDRTEALSTIKRAQFVRG